MACNGNCASCAGSCGGCGGGLTLTEAELEFLQELGQVAFLPVARTAADPTPVYPEAEADRQEFFSLLLQCLEKKALISLDYDRPLGLFPPEGYGAYPVRGSMALTERGQKVLEMLEYQGISEE